MLLFALAGGALAGYTTLRIWQVGRQDGRRNVDAIVVLGAAQYNGRPSPVLAARLDHAIELYKDGYAPYLVTTGGKLEGDNYTEAADRLHLRHQARRPGVGDPDGGHGLDHAAVHATRPGDFRRARPPLRPVRVGPEPYAAGPETRPGPGHRRLGVAHPDQSGRHRRRPHLELDGPRARGDGPVLHRERGLEHRSGTLATPSPMPSPTSAAYRRARPSPWAHFSLATPSSAAEPSAAIRAALVTPRRWFLPGPRGESMSGRNGNAGEFGPTRGITRRAAQFDPLAMPN